MPAEPTATADGDFLFVTANPGTVQWPVLARFAHQRVIGDAGLILVEDACRRRPTGKG